MKYRWMVASLVALVASSCVLDRNGQEEVASSSSSSSSGQGGSGQGGGAGQATGGGGEQGGTGGAGGNPLPCGDGTIDGGELCDDGNGVSGDGCDASCQLEPGWTCSNQPSQCTTSCGDGIAAGDELCDDGNQDNHDDCPDGVGGTCRPAACGDGFIDAVGPQQEQCDDGNATVGDGCGATCQQEAGYCCQTEGVACAAGPFVFSSGSLLEALPDNSPNSPICKAITVTDMGCKAVGTVTASFGINHSAVADVKVEVRSPAATGVLIVDQPNYPPQVPASTVNYEAAFMIHIADAFPTSSELIGSTLSNTQVACKDDGLCDYHPSPGSLSTFSGAVMAGVWQICAWDVESGDAGGSFVEAELAFTGL